MLAIPPPMTISSKNILEHICTCKHFLQGAFQTGNCWVVRYERCYTELTLSTCLSERSCQCHSHHRRINVPASSCVPSCFSHAQLFATLCTVARQVPLSVGFSRQEYWSGLPCPPPGDLPDSGVDPTSPVAPALLVDSLPVSHQGSPSSLLTPIQTIYQRIFFFFWSVGDNSEKAMASHSSTLAWKIPRAEDPGRLQSMGLLRVGHDGATSLSLFTFMHWRRKWQPTPVFLPGGSQGWGSLVGCHLWGRTESDMTEAT